MKIRDEKKKSDNMKATAVTTLRLPSSAQSSPSPPPPPVIPISLSSTFNIANETLPDDESDMRQLKKLLERYEKENQVGDID